MFKISNEICSKLAISIPERRHRCHICRPSILIISFEQILHIFLWSSLIYNTSARHERHECDTRDTSETRTARARQFHTKNYLLEMSRFHANIRLKSAPQKLNFLMAKAISKSCTLDCSCKCPCTFPHSYAQ